MFTEERLGESKAFQILKRVAGDSLKREDMVVDEFFNDVKFKDGLIESIRVKIVEEERSDIMLCFDFKTGEMLIYILICHYGKWAYELVGEDTIESTLKQIICKRLDYFKKDQISSIFE